MKIEFNEEQLMLRDTVKDLVNREIKSIAHKIDEEEEIPKELINKLAETGLLGTPFPENYGGGGFGEIGHCIAIEEMTRAGGSVAAFVGAHISIGTNAIYIGGSEELKSKYMPDLCSGNKIAAFALTEAEAGSDAFNLKCNAVLEDDYYILNGEKLWVTNGEIADIYSVFARTKKGITGFVVERDFEGITVGPREKKLGIKGSVTNSISFKNVKIPKENIIGTDGRGILIAMKALDSGRLSVGASCVGASKELLELSVEFANQRKQFDQPIIKFQAIHFMIAEITTSIYAQESMLYRAAEKYDEGKDVSSEAAIVKLFCSEELSKVADKALQIHGGMGFSSEIPIERFYRDARILRIFEGTSEIQKLIIGRKTIKNKGKWSD